MKIQFSVNDKFYDIDIKPNEILLNTLRGLGFKGVKQGCNEGVCGACTVLINNEPVNSCLVLSAHVLNKKIKTIEGLGDPNCLSTVQKAFLEAGAVQCGFCTPGMVLSTTVLLESNPKPNEEEIRLALDGNMCRCTGYTKIVDAVKLASSKLRDSRNDKMQDFAQM